MQNLVIASCSTRDDYRVIRVKVYIFSGLFTVQIVHTKHQNRAKLKKAKAYVCFTIATLLYIVGSIWSTNTIFILTWQVTKLEHKQDSTEQHRIAGFYIDFSIQFKSKQCSNLLTRPANKKAMLGSTVLLYQAVAENRHVTQRRTFLSRLINSNSLAISYYYHLRTGEGLKNVNANRKAYNGIFLT